MIISFNVFAVDNANIKRLRDQGIKNIGWVAGNVSSHPVNKQMRPMVGRGGSYYELLVGIALPGNVPEFEAASNVSLYDEWFKIGERQSFDERTCISKIKSSQQIIKDLLVEFKRIK